MLLPPICIPPSFSLKKGPYVIAFFLFVFPLKRAIIFFYFCWSICFRLAVQVLYMYNTLYWTWINLIRWLSLKKRWTSHIIHFRWTALRTTSIYVPLSNFSQYTDDWLFSIDGRKTLSIIHYTCTCTFWWIWCFITNEKLCWPMWSSSYVVIPLLILVLIHSVIIPLPEMIWHTKDQFSIDSRPKDRHPHQK